MASIGVTGAGTWGTALVVLLSSSGHRVIIWSTISEEVRELKETHTHRNLPDLHTPESARFTKDLKEVMEGRNLLTPAMPSAFVRGTAQEMKPYIEKGQVITNMAKGIKENILMTLSQIIEEELPETEAIALSGPNHAEEVSKGLPTTCVAGAHRRHAAEFIQGIFISQVLRVYTSPDILGIELGRALKNVITLAPDMTDGLGYGGNTKTALTTRGIAGVSCLGTNVGDRMEISADLTGIGDLVVTYANMYSRNRCVDILTGRGHIMEETMAGVNAVVEGVRSAKAALALPRQHHVSVPIAEQVNAILFRGMPTKGTVLELVLRDKRIENSKLEWEEE